MKFIEPSKEEKKLKDYLDSNQYKKVAIFWGHGIGDSLMFQVILTKLRELYPDISFQMAFPKGLDEEIIYPDAVFVNSREEAQNLDDFDLVAQINFPLEAPGSTKSELSCKNEIGIEPISGYEKVPEYPSPLVAVHFCLTSLPELVRPTKEVAEKIWNEVREAGLVPIECHFEHVFHNPENPKMDFINCTVRGCQAHLTSLFGLLRVSRAFIGVVSGPFHSAMSILPHDKILYLEKDIPVERFTHEPIQTIDLKNYKDGSVKEFLDNLNN